MNFRYLYLVFVLFVAGACSQNGNEFSSGGFTLGFNKKGQITQLTSNKSAVNYARMDNENALLAIRVRGKLEYPETAEFDENKGVITLTYPLNGVVAEVKIESKEVYLTLELLSLTNKEKVELVLWGPFQTSIKETVGETIGVVRDKEFSIGIQALNIRTLGGYPSSEDDSTPSYNIFATTSLVDISDSLNILYRGHTALPKEYGSSLQAYTRDRSKDRIVAAMNHEKYVAPAYDDEGVVGSKIAIFGCAPETVLDVIEKIELTENLPHPMLDGVWAKRATSATAAYLIQGFNSENIDDAIELTKKAGLKYLYQGGPFENWGHFDLHENGFPDNWESMKMCVEKAEKAGLKVGAHTLSNFITTNDPYVTPVPDQRLAKVGSSTLVKAIDDKEKNIEIESPDFFNQMKNNSLHAVVVGEEIIRYESVSEEKPWVLLNCERGAFDTNVSSHGKGDKISKLADHGYKTFLTNANLSVEVSGKLAELYNQTGLRQISFDGLEGNASTGMGAYGEALFVKNWFDNLNPEIRNDYIMDASRPGHYFWHMFTRMNWGEPWYAGFRESQTSYRLLNQDYFRRNFIPCMLGWFSMRDNTSIEDIEWMLARSAAFDAGYSLVTSAGLIAKNGFGDQILEKIKQWEKARMSKAFSADQKKRMEDIKAEFSLETVSDNSWNLIPYSVQRFEHKLIVRQPGEPVWSTFDFNNPYGQQPLGFILNTTNGATASKLFIEIDDFKKIDLDIAVKPNQYLKYTGGDEVALYDQNWNLLETIKVDPSKFTLAKGAHKIKVDCRFAGSDKASLKLELKTAGEPEKVVAGK
ncbi:hypothetical protein [Reichenbachiella sp. MALMAid0571]|uniref:hypothetical protein n=1 Tax=Reichenbachiella sp. MALMAid0571 TaxID=3143939 RepID=UPI0032DFC589